MNRKVVPTVAGQKKADIKESAPHDLPPVLSQQTTMEIIANYQAKERQFKIDLEERLKIERETEKLNLSDEEWQNKISARRFLSGTAWAYNFIRFYWGYFIELIYQIFLWDRCRNFVLFEDYRILREIVRYLKDTE